MSDVTYAPYNKKSLLVHGDREKYGTKIKEVGGRWNNRVKGGPGWTVPVENEKDLKKLILDLKKEERLETMSNRAKPNKEQKRYHRAVSDPESETSSGRPESESERESERESEKESRRVKPKEVSAERPVKTHSPRRSEVMAPIRETRQVKKGAPGERESEDDVSRSPPREARNKKTYREDRHGGRHKKYQSPVRESKPPPGHSLGHGAETRKEPRRYEDRRREDRPREREEVRRTGKDGPEEEYYRMRKPPAKRRSPPRKKKSPELTDSESDYSSSGDDFPSPDRPTKKKSHYDLEREMHRKIRDLEKQVEAIKLEKRTHRHR